MGKPGFSKTDIKECEETVRGGDPAASQPVQMGSSCCGPLLTEAIKGGMAKVAGYGEEVS